MVHDEFDFDPHMEQCFHDLRHANHEGRLGDHGPTGDLASGHSGFVEKLPHKYDQDPNARKS
jgi:hypothetical protein